MASVLSKYSPTFLVQIYFGGVIFEDTDDVEFSDTDDVEWDMSSFQERYATKDFYDADGNYWKGTLINFPYVIQELTDSYFGVEQSMSVLLRFANPRDDIDDSWEVMTDAEDLRGRWIKLQKYDPTDGTTFVMRGKIIRYLLGAEVEIEAEGRDDAILETLLPKKVVTTDEFTSTALDLGKAINICLGHCRNVPLHNIQNNTDSNEYDYLIGYGTIESLDVDHANGKGVKREGILVSTTEYTFYDGSQVNPYPGYAFLRFTVEQMDFSGGFHNLTADVRGLEMGEAAAQRNFARVVEQFLSNATWGLGDKVLSSDLLEDEDCEDISDWADQDAGVAVSSQVNNAPIADPVDYTFEFNTNASSIPNDFAQRVKNVGSIDALGNRIVVSIKTYCKTVGTLANQDMFVLQCRRSDMNFAVAFASDGLYIHDGAAWHEVGTDIVDQDVWQVWTFDIDISTGAANATCDVYLDGTLKATGIDCSTVGIYADGECYFTQFGYTTDNQILYVDWFKVGDGFENNSFNAAAHHLNTIGSLYCDGPLTEQRKARDIINDLLLSARAVIERNADEEWIINIDVVGAASVLNLGENDGYYNNVTVVDRHVPSVSETLGTCYVHYALNAANNEKGFYELHAKAFSFGTDLTLELPFVCEHATAKKVLSYQVNRAVYGGRKVVLSPVGLEGRDLSRGDIITLDAPDHNINSLQYKIESISRDAISRELICGTYDARIYDDIPMDDPTDESGIEYIEQSYITVCPTPGLADFVLIADAIDALPADGGQLFLKNGIYQQTDELVIPDKNLTVTGESLDGVILKNNPGDNLFVLNNLTKRLRFSSFSIESQNVAAYSSMFYLYGGTNAVNAIIEEIDFNLVDNNIIGAAAGDRGIYGKDGTSDGSLKVYTCSFQNGLHSIHFDNYYNTEISKDNISKEALNTGFLANDCPSIKINTNRVLDFLSTGIMVLSATSVSGHGTITENTVIGKDDSLAATDLYGILLDTHEIIVNGNHVTIISSRTGLSCMNGITSVSIYGGNIVGNEIYIYNIVATDIQYGMLLNSIFDLTCSSNKVKVCDSDVTNNHYGLCLKGSDRNTLNSNILDLVNNNAKDIGISMDAASQNNQGSNNITYQVGTSIQDLGAGNTVTAKDV